MPNEPSIDSTINHAVTTCTKEVTVRKEDFDLIANLPPPPNGDRICNPLSGHFIGCVHSYLFVVRGIFIEANCLYSESLSHLELPQFQMDQQL